MMLIKRLLLHHLPLPMPLNMVSGTTQYNTSSAVTQATLFAPSGSTSGFAIARAGVDEVYVCGLFLDNQPSNTQLSVQEWQA